MSSTTISLERSAYELLRSKKRPGESFSEELFRLLGNDRSKLMGFLDIVPGEAGDSIADAIEAVREEDLRLSRSRHPSSGGRRGRRS